MSILHHRLLLRPSISPNATLLSTGARFFEGGPGLKPGMIDRWKKAEKKAEEAKELAVPKQLVFSTSRPVPQPPKFKPFFPHAPAPGSKQRSRQTARPAPGTAKPAPKRTAATRHFTAPHKKKLLSSCSPFSRMRGDPKTIIVHTSGVCGQQDVSIAGVGVWFGPESPHNISLPLSAVDPLPAKQWVPLQERAQIKAATLGLQTLWDVAKEDKGERSVLLATDKYLWRVMTDLVYKWRRNGWTNEGQMVKNWELLKELDKTAHNMEMVGWSVRFWGVLKTNNKEAEQLAKEAIRRAKEMASTGGGVTPQADSIDRKTRSEDWRMYAGVCGCKRGYAKCVGVAEDYGLCRG